MIVVNLPLQRLKPILMMRMDAKIVPRAVIVDELLLGYAFVRNLTL
jgi:hypothetical protein